MRAARLIAPLLLLSCGSDPTDDAPADGVDPDTDVTDTDTDVGPDTDPPDTDVGPDTDADTDPTGAVDTGETGLGAAGQVWHHVIWTLELLPSNQGFDLDGDTVVDNALGNLSDVFNQLIAMNYPLQDRLGVLQMWDVEDGDDLAQVGILTGRDVDGDLSDNFSGSEELRPLQTTVGPYGRALIHADTELDPLGAYTATLPPGVFDIGVFQIPLSAEIQVRGTANASQHAGQVGSAIAVADLQAMLGAVGLGAVAGAAALFADLDLDGDGNPDAISVAFDFRGVPCTLPPPPPVP